MKFKKLQITKKGTFLLVALFIGILGISATAIVTQTNIFPDDGNVGVGTITPSTKHHIVGNSRVDGIHTVYGAGSSTGLVSCNSPGSSPGFIFRSNDPESYRGDIRYTKNGFQLATHGATNIPPVRMSILNDGNVGMGLTNPVSKLNIQQNGGLLRLYSGQNGGHTYMCFYNNGGPGSTRAGWIGYGNNGQTKMTIKNETPNGDIQLFPDRYILLSGDVKGHIGTGATRFRSSSGYVDIGPKNTAWSHFVTDRPRFYFNREIHVNSGKISSYDESLKLSGKAWSMFFDVNTDNVGSDYFQWRAKNQNIMRLSTNGNLCIGCENAQNRLDVNGTVRANEVVVENGWADYVFKPDYNLPTLKEEAQFIQENGYLKGFESEAAMNNEINIGKVTKAQQVKIEELMLHMIEKDKQIERLEKHINTLLNSLKIK